jgi:glycosyltransferase involved in cell wall biosynthesis
MNKVKITIITTVKNGSKYILDTLESINNQTYREFEHIVVDDGSTDNTVELLLKFKQEHPEYKLVIFEPGHLGRGKALNYAVNKANFEWIAIIDADDIWHPNKLEAQINILNSNPDISVLATKTGLFTEQVYFKEYNEFSFEVIKPKRMLYKSIISHSSVVINRKYAKYDENRTSQFDAELWFRLAFDEKKVLAIVLEELNFHRIHANQNFEASRGQAYQFNAMKLSLGYCFKNLIFFPIFIYVLKFFYRLIIPRKLRFKKVK